MRRLDETFGLTGFFESVAVGFEGYRPVLLGGVPGCFFDAGGIPEV